MPTLTTRRQATTQERQDAAERRAAGSVQMGYRTRGASAGGPFSPPEGTARSLGFPAELRAKKVTYNEQELYHLHGIASVTDTAYEMWDWAGPYDEIVDGGAFDVTLAADPDVSFLVNHKGLTMARTVPMAGKAATLLLGMEDTGLGTDAYVNPKRDDVSRLVIAIDDGNVTEMSFAFMLVDGWWSQDFMTFKITEVDINRGDVSAVNYGANPYTSISARQREILSDVASLPIGAARAALRELMGRQDVDVDQLYRAYASGVTRDRAAPTGTVAGPVRPMGRSLIYAEALLAEDE